MLHFYKKYNAVVGYLLFDSRIIQCFVLEVLVFCMIFLVELVF